MDIDKEIAEWQPNGHRLTDIFAGLAEQIHANLGCTEEVTKKYIEGVLVGIKVFDKKQSKYGSGNIADFGESGVLIRANDKMNRLKNLFRTNQEPQDETKDDTWGDLHVYSNIALMCRWGWWPGVKPTKAG